MKTSLSAEQLQTITRKLTEVNRDFADAYPGETGRRQPVHTVYGGAHLFKADTTARLATLALRALEQSAPDAVVFAKAIGLPGSEGLPNSLEQNSTFNSLLETNPEILRREHKPAWLAHTIYSRVVE